MFWFVKNFISVERAEQLANDLDDRVANGDYRVDIWCPGSQSFDQPFNAFHNEILEQTSKVVGKKLDVTYNYARVYWPGDRLNPHTDREACEWSISLNLRNNEHPWPFCVEYNLNKQCFDMEPGDAVIYNGPGVKHWRDPLESDCVYQAFFHFVDLDGDFKDHAKDRIVRSKKWVGTEKGNMKVWN